MPFDVLRRRCRSRDGLESEVRCQMMPCTAKGEGSWRVPTLPGMTSSNLLVDPDDDTDAVVDDEPSQKRELLARMRPTARSIHSQNGPNQTSV